MKILKPFFYITDIGFILYWMASLFLLIPESMLFKDYHNPIMVSWNWSFFPLDIMVSITGLISLYLYNKQLPSWSSLCLISLVLTFCSGLQAIVFFILQNDYDLTWWIPNLYLLLYPIYFIVQLVRGKLQ